MSALSTLIDGCLPAPIFGEGRRSTTKRPLSIYYHRIGHHSSPILGWVTLGEDAAAAMGPYPDVIKWLGRAGSCRPPLHE